jgi:transposase InsO family protein
LSEEERQQIHQLLHSARFVDQAPRQIYATLLSEGVVLASISTFYRLLRSQGESQERRRQRPPTRYAVPRLSASAPNQVWTWDITRLPTLTRGVFLYLYVILDLYSRFVVGWMVSRKENAGLAKHLFVHTLRRHGIPYVPTSNPDSPRASFYVTNLAGRLVPSRARSGVANP